MEEDYSELPSATETAPPSHGVEPRVPVSTHADPAAHTDPAAQPPQPPPARKPTFFPSGISMAVVPAVRIGAFYLGTGLRETAAYLSCPAGAKAYGEVEVHCDDQHPVGKDVVLHIPRASLTLTFDATTSAMRSATLETLVGVELWVGQKLLCGQNAMPTFVRLYDLLGPTFGSDIDPTTGEYVLRYPGLEVTFIVPEAFRVPSATAGGGVSAPKEHPVLLPDGTTPVAQKLTVLLPGASSVAAPSAGLAVPPAAVVRILWNEGVAFGHTGVLRFGASVQDAGTLLGPPNDCFLKDDARLLIHAARRGGGSKRHQFHAKESLLCFLNYPSLGIDLGFSMVSGTLEKIILYNAVPPHEAFLRYHRCHYDMTLTPGGVRQLLATDAAPLDAAQYAHPPVAVLRNETKWTDFVRQLGDCLLGPSSSTRDADIARLVPDPLLATPAEGILLRLYALDGLLACVVASTDVVASVTLVRAARVVGVCKTASISTSVPADPTPAEPKLSANIASPTASAVDSSSTSHLPVTTDATSSPGSAGPTASSLNGTQNADSDTVVDESPPRPTAPPAALPPPHPGHPSRSAPLPWISTVRDATDATGGSPPTDSAAAENAYESDFHSDVTDSRASVSPAPCEDYNVLARAATRFGQLPPLSRQYPPASLLPGADAAHAAGHFASFNEDSTDNLFPSLGSNQRHRNAQFGGSADDDATAAVDTSAGADSSHNEELPPTTDEPQQPSHQHTTTTTLADLLGHSQGSSNGSKKKGKKGRR